MPEDLLTIITPELILRYRVIPLGKHGSTLTLGVIDPTDQAAINAMVFHTGLRITPVIISEKQLNEFIETFCINSSSSILLNELNAETTPAIKENTINYDEPLIKFVDHIIQHAIQKSASDIHIEPYENECRIRYRQDGVLYEINSINPALAARLVTRLKVMAQLNISERRLPQDGRFQLIQKNHPIDIRINTCPTIFGEKIVMRLLDMRNVTLTIDTLGFTPPQKNLFLQKISEPQGLILVSGPTGSGKTLTLYSALHYLNTPAKNISTVEDPVEIQVPGINQVSVHPKIGLDFATALRTFLRQDPDIIMLGEIRDQETAVIAMQAAQTGHLVLSTVHTNSAIETLTRLAAMGVATHDVVNAVSLIIAQRLVRKLCPHCKIPENAANFPIELVAGATAFRARGCKHCLHGYQGRIGIYEMLAMTEELAQLISSRTNTYRLGEHLQRQGFLTLQNSALTLLNQGITSLSEINRVIRNYPACA
jgi:type IV pilus assembly protein PilB